jgi:hypothetical protein
MRTLSNREKAFSYSLYGSGEDGLVTFVLSVPISQLDAFISYADHRKKIYAAPVRSASPETVARSAAEYKSYCEDVLLFCDSFIKKSFSRSQAISEANKAMKSKSYHCTYERTKNIVFKYRKVTPK